MSRAVSRCRRGPADHRPAGSRSCSAARRSEGTTHPARRTRRPPRCRRPVLRRTSAAPQRQAEPDRQRSRRSPAVLPRQARGRRLELAPRSQRIGFGRGHQAAWIIASRSRCSISRSARRFAIASHSTATPAKIINERTIRMTSSSDTPASMRSIVVRTACNDGTLDRAPRVLFQRRSRREQRKQGR